MKSLFVFSGVLFLSLGLMRCSLPETKEGKFKADSNKVVADIEEQGGFEMATIMCQTIVINDSTTFNVDITLVNGSKFPNLNGVTEETGKRFAKMVSDEMMNASEFDKFTVTFVDETNFIVGSSSKSKEYVFKPGDLK